MGGCRFNPRSVLLPCFYKLARPGLTPLLAAVVELASDPTASTPNQAVEVLLTNAANPNASRDEKGYTPLHLATEGGCTVACRLLTDAKANVFAKTAEGESPLHLAAEHGHVDIIPTLASIAIAKDGYWGLSTRTKSTPKPCDPH